MHPHPPWVARRLPGPGPVPEGTAALRRAVEGGRYAPPVDAVVEAILAWVVRAPDLAVEPADHR